jgi:hypothetical protein
MPLYRLSTAPLPALQRLSTGSLPALYLQREGVQHAAQLRHLAHVLRHQLLQRLQAALRRLPAGLQRELRHVHEARGVGGVLRGGAQGCYSVVSRRCSVHTSGRGRDGYTPTHPYRHTHTCMLWVVWVPTHPHPHPYQPYPHQTPPRPHVEHAPLTALYRLSYSSAPPAPHLVRHVLHLRQRRHVVLRHAQPVRGGRNGSRATRGRSTGGQ